MLAFASCNSEDDKTIYFIGDQMFDNMDMDAAFPTKHLVNCAASGMHLDSLIKCPIQVPSDAVAVVLLGMHDIGAGASTAGILPEYFDKYEQMVCKLGAERVVVVSLLPTRMQTRNDNIFAFNKEMRYRFEAYPSISFLDVTYRFVDEDDMLDVQYARRDGQLLNDYGYQLLAEMINKVL